ncbi:hypothetical protein LM594_00540 [Candidatus Caldipriscus sp.]|nr:hypothetical protein [Candidatus Caldipriscus sp.]
MKRFSALFFFALPLLAQPFTYLGIVDGQVRVFSGVRKNVVSVTGFGSTVSTATKVETLLVNQSFTYMGYNAKGIERRVYYDATPSPIYVDTVYEVGDTMRRLMVIGRTSSSTVKASVRALLTPFSVGNSWTLGIAGNTYVADIDGDTNWTALDTFVITNDSVYVVSMGTISVPAGTFDSVYTIRLRLEGRMWSSIVYSRTGSSSAAWSDTLYRDYYIYWRPHLGYVKDSAFQYGKWHYLFVNIRVYSWETALLEGYWTSLAERRYAMEEILISKGYVYLPEFGRVYDITGKKVAEGKGKIYLKKGVYFVQSGGRKYKVIVR